MPGIPRELVEHTLQLYPDAKPIKQYMHCFFEPKHIAIGQEVDRLLAAKCIREIKKSDWLANPVLVETKDKNPSHVC